MVKRMVGLLEVLGSRPDYEWISALKTSKDSSKATMEERACSITHMACAKTKSPYNTKIGNIYRPVKNIELVTGT